MYAILIQTPNFKPTYKKIHHIWICINIHDFGHT